MIFDYTILSSNYLEELCFGYHCFHCGNSGILCELCTVNLAHCWNVKSVCCFNCSFVYNGKLTISEWIPPPMEEEIKRIASRKSHIICFNHVCFYCDTVYLEENKLKRCYKCREYVCGNCMPRKRLICWLCVRFAKPPQPPVYRSTKIEMFNNENALMRKQSAILKFK